MKRYAFLFVVVLAVCGAAFGDTWYVDGANTSGTEDGLSWDTAFTVIQQGIDAAGGGDEVWVATEAYPEGITLASGVSVYGGFDGTEENLSERDVDANVTIIDATAHERTIGEGTETWYSPMHTFWHDSRTQVIYLSSEIGSAGWISSLALDVATIPGQMMNDWTIRMKHTSLSEYTTAEWEGSGWTTVYQNNETVSSTGWVTFNFFTPFHYNGTDNLMIDFSFNNSSWTGSGLCRYSIPGGNRTIDYYSDSLDGDPLAWSGTTPSPYVTTYVPNIRLGVDQYHGVVMEGTTDARIDGFVVTGGNANGPYPDDLGGGIFCNTADATNTIANCTITGNSAAAFGGGVTCIFADPAITDCTISGNSAAIGAGGLAIAVSTSQITNCVIAANAAASSGGGLYFEMASPSITNCTISANEAAFSGGGLVCTAGSSPSIANTIFEDNTNQAISETGPTDDPIVTNCLFYNNPDGDYFDEGTTIYTGGTDINTNIPEASGNLSGNPYFVMGGVAATAGIWTDVTLGPGVTILTDDNASFTPDALVGKLINPDLTQQGQVLIVANTETTIDVIGDVTGYVSGTDWYHVVDYHLMYDSAAIDAGAAGGAPSEDFDGDPRPFDAPGLGADGTGEEFDIGVDEFVDTDEDWLSDYEEALLGTDPDDPDSDGDGLTDYEETYWYGTDPNDADSDDDGLNDYDEVYIYGTFPLDDDSDNDGLNDYDEVITYDTNPWNPDSDDDGLTDGDEVNTHGTDPNDVDTDDDGYTDDIEVTAGSNPTDPDSYPLWYVDEDATGAADGTSWEDAFTVIQDGITAAAALSGAVWVADGTHLGSVTLASGVAVMGGFDGTEELLSERDIEANVTMIEASGAADEQTIGEGTGVWELPMHTFWHDSRTQVIYLSSEIGSAGAIASLALDVTALPGQTMNYWTIRMKHTSLSEYTTAAWEGSGWTTVYQNNETVSSTGWVTFNFSTPFNYNGTDNLMIDFSHNNSSWTSSGYCRYSTPGGNRTVFSYTDSSYGDPLAWSGTTNPTPTVTTNVPNIRLGVDQYHAVLMSGTTDARIDGFTITGGNADGAGPNGWGGGILALSANGTNTIANCTITGNSAALFGGGVTCAWSSSGPAITDCTISGNSAGAGGGGVALGSFSSPITNCVISGNSAAYAGGVYCEAAAPSITNCTISANEALSGGGVYCTATSAPSITNTIFEDNTNHAVEEAGSADDATVTNCLFYNNPDGDYLDEGTTSYTGADDINSIPDGLAINNVDDDPVFVMNGPAGFTGTWTDVTPDSGVTILTGTSASFTPGALVGKLVNGNTSQRGQVLIVANTATTVEVLGDVTGYVAVDDAYQVIDYHLRNGSPAIDMGGVAEIVVGDGMVTDTEPNDTIATAQNIDSDMWSLIFSPDIGDTTTNTSESILHVTILGTGNESLDVYSFTVANAGDRGIFDIDYGYNSGGSVDCYIRLYDSDGTMIDYDDDEINLSYGQGGSVHAFDSYLEHTFAAPGVYYIEVARYSHNPIPIGADYQLQISLENHEFPTTALPTDFDGEPRPIDVAGLGADGTGEEFDIGADEYLDTDGDGLSDQEEIVLGTDPGDPDTDNDGANDGDEVNTHGTDPNDPDSDDDGLPDGWEVDNGFDPLDGTGDNGGDGDPDGDGLTNEGEHANGTDPNDPDSDDDTLPDGWEVNSGLDPNDGTGDNGAGGDPDGDGLTNAGEYSNGTDPNDSDSDGDGLPDGWEVGNNLDPNDDTGDNGANGDPDGDGITNLEEYEEGYDPGLAAPVAALDASVTSGVRPLEVEFKDESTGSITSRGWSFGDGYTTAEQDPSHTYYFTGDFTVTLTVVGPGGVDSATAVIQVDQALAADARAYKAVINGIKVKYSKPTCFATYNDMQDSLVIAVWGDEPGALNVIATDEALLHWGSRCDIVIDAPDTYIKKINLKGIPDLLDLYVCGQAGYVMNFILKEGYVGDTAHYGEEFGLGSDALDPAKKILIKNGATTAPLFGIGYSALRAIPASVAEALANLEMEIRLKSKPFVGPELADYEYDYEYDYEEDEDMKHAEIEFAEVEASVETKAAYVTEVDGVKVRYSKPGCVAYRNVDDGTLTIQITESDGNLLVKCGAEAYLGWGNSCDVVIVAADTSVNTMVLKGNLDTQLYVGGNVQYVKNFKLKYGAVGDTDFYGPEIGLGCTSLIPPSKILIQWGWTTAPLLGVSY